MRCIFHSLPSENLTRRTNLFQCLEDPYGSDKGREWSYPLPEFGTIIDTRLISSTTRQH